MTYEDISIAIIFAVVMLIGAFNIDSLMVMQ